ncbi:MAG: hypothetical protein AAGF20_02990 [Pseudomonadota bacterium]
MSERLPDERVLALIDAYGAELEAWPEAERAGAEAALSASPERFADALAQARALDGALRMLQDGPEPSANLAAVILAAAPQPVTKARSKIGFLPWLRMGWRNAMPEAVIQRPMRGPVAAMAASLGLGLVGGYAYAANQPDTALEEAYSWAFEAPMMDWVSEGEAG